MLGIEEATYDVTRNRLEHLKRAASEEWPFDDWDWILEDRTLVSYAESQLVGGESEQEFASRLSRAIWNAHKSYCPVVVDATCLEDLPSQTYTTDFKDYKAWKKETAEEERRQR